MLPTNLPSCTDAIRPRCKRRLIVLYSRRDIKSPNSKYSSSNSLFGSYVLVGVMMSVLENLNA